MKGKRWYKRAAAPIMAGCIAGTLVFPLAQPVTAQAAEEGIQWDDVQKIVSRYYGEWDDQEYEGAITSRIPHTALLGNGDVGITSYGTEGEKSFLISKGDFWNYNGTAITLGGVTVKEVVEQSEEYDRNLTAKVSRAWESSTYEGHSAMDTISGYEKGMEGWTTEVGKPQWIAYEFEEPVTIGEWILIGDGGSRGDGQKQNNPKDFEVQISSNGEDWVAIDTVEGNSEGIVDHLLINPVTTKYLRFYFTTPTQESDWDSTNNPRGRVAQVFLYEDNGNAEEYAVENLAQDYSDTKASSTDADHTPSKAVDGDFVYGNEGWVSSIEQTPWVAYKYDEAVTIGSYKLLGDSAIRDEGSAANNPRAFKIQISSDDAVWADDYNEEEDGALWQTIDEVTENVSGTILRTLPQAYEAKYVRVWFDQPVQSADEANPRGRLGRFEFYAETDPSTAVEGDGSGVYEGTAPGPGSNGPFSEKMNLDTADIDTSIYFGDAQVEINTWTAEGKNLLIQEMTSKAENDLDLEISTWVKNDNAQYPTNVKEKDGQIYVTRQTREKDKNKEDSYISEAALTTYVVGAPVDEQHADEDDASAEQYVTLPAGETIYLVTAVGGGGQTYKASDMSLIGDDPVKEAEELGKEAENADDIAALRAEHDDWWQDFWTRSYIDFGTEDANLNKIQSYYYGSLYLLGSALREDGLAAGLYGNWFTTDSPNWSADYHLNYNFIAAYYGLNSTNHSELTLPAGQALLDYMDEGLSRGQNTSELREIVPDEFEDELLQPKIDSGLIDEENGIEGAVLYPVGIGPFGTTCDDNYHQEAMNAAYSAYPMMEYYDYTQDKSYLEDGLYDLLKACGAYYEAWLTKEDTEDGDYVYALYAAYNEGSFSKNPAVELATVKNLFSHLVEYSKILDKDENKRAQWEELLAHLPAQPTAEASGGESLSLAELEAVKSGNTFTGEWAPMNSPIPGDGNAIPLDAVIPGNVFNHYSSPEDIQLVLNTIQTFVNSGNPWGQINNFPRIFPEAVEAGYDINTIVNAFVGQLNDKLEANLTIDDNNHGFEKAGSIETINQMLLNSECNTIDVFPNWLSNKDAEFANFSAKGGFTVSAGYDGTEQAVSHVEITSTLGNDCRLVSPWGGEVIVKDEDGKTVDAKCTDGIPYYEQYDADGEPSGYHDGTLVTFETEKGKTYTITRVYSDDETAAVREELSSMIEKATAALEEKTPDDELYNEEVNKALSSVIEEAKAVYADSSATYTDMRAQTVALQNALDTFDLAYKQWERPLGDPTMNGDNPHLGEFDGYKVIAWEKDTGRFEYPSGSIADVLEIPSGTVVSNMTIDVSYYYDQVDGNSWWHFNTYDENGESAPGVSNGKPHDDGFGDFPGDYKMVSGQWAIVSVSRDNQMLGSGKADWFINVGGAGTDNSNSLYIRGYRITVTLDDGTVKTATWGVMDDEIVEQEKPSKNTLGYFLNAAKEHQANGDVDNCVESIKNLFAEAIAEGEAVMADENATYEEVMDATVKLMKAIQALDFKAADKTDLEMAVELAQGIDLTKYVEAGQAEFQQALAAAQEVLADGDAMQTDADTAWNALVDAISNLRLKADKSTLEDLLNSVADLDLSQYTEESAAVFHTALANAQAVLADESLTEDDQKTVDNAVQALSDAKDQLQLKDISGDNNGGNGDANTGTGDGSDNTGNGDSQVPGNGDNSGNNGNSNAKADAPKTGDTAPIMGLIMLGILSGAAALTISRKRVK